MQSISPIMQDGQSNSRVKETRSVTQVSFSDNRKSTWSMPVSHTPYVGFSIPESVSSFRKVHETSQSIRFSELISTWSTLVSSGPLRDDFKPVVMTSFTSDSLSTIQGSSAFEKFFTPTKATSLSVTRKSDPSTPGLRSTNQVVSEKEKRSVTISTSPQYTPHYGTPTAGDIRSMKTTVLSYPLQTSPSISPPPSVINATSFRDTVILNSNSDVKSSLLGSSPGELDSLPVAIVSPYGSVSTHITSDYLSKFASEATTNGFSSWIATQNIASHIPSPNSKSALASRKRSIQRWHAERSTNSNRQLNPKSSVKERLPTNLTIQTSKLVYTNQQTLLNVC